MTENSGNSESDRRRRQIVIPPARTTTQEADPSSRRMPGQTANQMPDQTVDSVEWPYGDLKPSIRGMTSGLAK